MADLSLPIFEEVLLVFPPLIVSGMTEQCTRKTLQEICKKNNLPSDGTKGELMERLKHAAQGHLNCAWDVP
jgi:hypothetical protein